MYFTLSFVVSPHAPLQRQGSVLLHPAFNLYTYLSGIAWGWLPWYIVALVFSYLTLDALWCLAHHRPVAHRWIMRFTSLETTVIVCVFAVLFDFLAFFIAISRYREMIVLAPVCWGFVILLLCFFALRLGCFPVHSRRPPSNCD